MTLTADCTIYVATWWYRDNDALGSVAGFDRKAVEAKARECMRHQEDLDTDDDDGTFPMSELVWSGINAFVGKEAMKDGSLGIPEENIAELEQDGITVY